MERVTVATRIGVARPSGGYPSFPCQESGHPHFFFLSAGLLRLLQSLLLIHLSPPWQGKGVLFAVRRCREVSEADVSRDRFSGRLLAFAMQLPHGAEVSKKVSREDVA